MTLHVDDDGFVRAPAGLVYPVLTAVDAWGTWWPGVTSTPADGDGRHALRLRRPGPLPWTLQDAVVDLAGGAPTVGLAARRAALRLDLVATGGAWRHDEGFVLELGGDLVGRAEFWLEAVAGGTVIHHLLWATPADGIAAVPALTTYRRALRAGLLACKDRVQSDVRTRLGMQP